MLLRLVEFGGKIRIFLFFDSSAYEFNECYVDGDPKSSLFKHRVAILRAVGPIALSCPKFGELPEEN